MATCFEDAKVQSAFREHLAAPREFEMVMSGRHLHLGATSIQAANGEYVGRVTEWRDRTNEVSMEREVAAVIEATGRGSFDATRGNLALADEDRAEF